MGGGSERSDSQSERGERKNCEPGVGSPRNGSKAEGGTVTGTAGERKCAEPDLKRWKRRREKQQKSEGVQTRNRTK